MKYESMIDVFKDGEIVIPMYMYKMYPSFNVSLYSFIFLMYLRGLGNMIEFNIPKFSDALGVDNGQIMNYVEELEKAKLVEIKLIKNDKGVMDEFISLEGLYSKIGLNMTGTISKEINESKDDIESIFKVLEKEIGKQLSPMEIEIVKGWKESNYSDDLIKEAIREAVINNAVTLRYIDKILYTWYSKGINTIEEVEKSRKDFRENKKKTEKKVEIYDSDEWLEGNEDN